MRVMKFAPSCRLSRQALTRPKTSKQKVRAKPGSAVPRYAAAARRKAEQHDCQHRRRPDQADAQHGVEIGVVGLAQRPLHLVGDRLDVLGGPERFVAITLEAALPRM